MFRLNGFSVFQAYIRIHCDLCNVKHSIGITAKYQGNERLNKLENS